MKTLSRVLIAALMSVPVFAADTPGFALWKASELQQRIAALSKNVAADHSSRETLADYGDHRFRLLYRDADGNPEQHDHIIDIVMVQSGEGTLVLGGKMLGQRAGSGDGEYVGTSIEGGERHSLGPGDVLQIPERVPHAFLVPRGKTFAYVLLKIPAAR
jgi:hypothetical protein